MKKITEIKVAGTTFHPLPQNTFLAPNNTDEVDGIPVAYFTAVLMPEPTNQFDPDAVQVILPTTTGNPFMIGYLPKDEPLKMAITEPVMGEVMVKDYRVAGNYNPSYIITSIEMEG